MHDNTNPPDTLDSIRERIDNIEAAQEELEEQQEMDAVVKDADANRQEKISSATKQD
ncbi:MAG TPA: hypothetical protein VFE38_16515 [Edaphobacter sp.]|nr:hypothetical protein [Edaphobacter sp.]